MHVRLLHVLLTFTLFGGTFNFITGNPDLNDGMMKTDELQYEPRYQPAPTSQHTTAEGISFSVAFTFSTSVIQSTFMSIIAQPIIVHTIYNQF